MKLRSLLLASCSLFLVSSSVDAQIVPGAGPMVPSNSSSGTVVNSPAKAIPYFPVAGNKVVGGSVLTFDPSTGKLSTNSVTATTGISGTYLSGTTNLTSLDGAGKIIDSTIPLNSVVYDGVATGTANAIIVTTTSPAFTLSPGSIVSFIATNFNSAATTVNVNGTGNIPVFRSALSGSVTLAGGEIVSGESVLLYYDGTNFQFINPPPAPMVLSAIDELSGSADARQLTVPDIRLGSPDSFATFVSSFTNTGPMTVTINGVIGPAPIVKPTSSGLVPLVAGDLLAGSKTNLGFNGTSFQLLNPSSQVVTPSGNTTSFVTNSGPITSGNCLQGDAFGNAVSTATPCSTSSGSVNPGTSSQVGTYATTGSTISGASALTFDGTNLNTPQLIVSGANGVFGDSNALNLGTFDGTFYTTGIYIDGTTFTVRSLLPFSGFNTITANALRPPSCVQVNPFILGSIGVSETINVNVPCSLAASYNFNMPTTAGTAGQVLTSQGGLTNAMTWSTPGSGTVNAGTINQMTWYAGTGDAVSGLPTLASGILNTSAGGVPSITASPTISGTFTAGGFSGPLNGSVGSTTPSTGAFTTIKDTSFSGNQIPYANGFSTFISSSDLLFDGTTFSTNIARLRSIVLSSSLGTGTVSRKVDPSNFAPYAVTEPTTAGTAGQPLLSSGGGATPQTYGALTGSGGTFATSSGVPSDGCAVWTTGNIGSTGSPCPTSSVYVGTDGGTANAKVVASTGYVRTVGSIVTFTATLTNAAGATTANINGTGVANILIPKPSGPLATLGGEIVQNNTIVLEWDGTQYQFINPPSQVVTTTISTPGAYSITPPRAVSSVMVLAFGAAGGGGSGDSIGSVGTGAGGNGGGGGQRASSGWFPNPNATISGTIGTGGAGGTGGSGGSGASGPTTVIVSGVEYMRAVPGGGGTAGGGGGTGGGDGDVRDSTGSFFRITNAGGGTTNTQIGNYASVGGTNAESGGGGGGSPGNAAVAGSNGGTSRWGAGGGGGGGGVVGAAFAAGGAGGVSNSLPGTFVSGGGGGTAGTICGNGGAGAGRTTALTSGSGGGGGGGCITGPGGTGGAGGFPGGGGGGGGTGITSGPGGLGGNGQLIFLFM